MKNILIIMGRYLPGYKDGGPVRSIKNLVDRLGHEYQFHILTCDRDHGDNVPYPNVHANSWNQVGMAKVYYVSPKGFSVSVIKRLTSEADLVYICGCYNNYAIKSLLLKRLGLIEKPVVIAAMGLFMPNAMKKKPLKYNIFLKLFYMLGMFKKITWSATSEFEAKCIRKYVDPNADYIIAQDLPRLVEPVFPQKDKQPNELKVFFLSRISPEKNLLKTIHLLRKCNGKIQFTIYGPIHDENYWDLCLTELRKLPDNIKWAYEGNIASELVVETIRQQHIFLFLTIGENYGHVIQEALSAGCPCIISDQTPWKNLETEKIGCLVPLDREDDIVQKIEHYVSMNKEEFQQISERAVKYAMHNSVEKTKTTGYRDIFDGVIK